MPKIFRVTLEHGSVADSLSHIKQDILPKEIASDPLAQWIMSFDELENQDHQRDFRMDQIDRSDRYDGMYLLCRYLSASILQTQMPFYFASLFHIGRQWQVALFSLESIEDVEKQE